VAANFHALPIGRDPGRTRLLYGIAFFWGLCIAALLVLLLAAYGFQDSTTRFYLLPWCLATGVLIAAEPAWIAFKGKFDPFHPLVFPAWSYFVPEFAIGGIFLACGLSQPYYLAYVQNDQYYLPLTLLYVVIGYLSLAAGFALPWPRRLGRRISAGLPEWEIRDAQVPLAAALLLLTGVVSIGFSFIRGLFGYQRSEDVPAYTGLLFMVTLFWMMGSFLIWLYVFRGKLDLTRAAIGVVLLAISLAKALLYGNRSGLILTAILIGAAYAFAKRDLRIRHYVIGVFILAACLFLGMIYGTLFRSVKGGEERVSPEQYLGAIAQTFDTISDQDLKESVNAGSASIAERLDGLSSLAVVVANYEALAPYEERWGISNDIYTESITFFIPRIFWPEKPVAIDLSRYGDLYFNYSENAFAITPMGDLLRNFGPIGVPLGMLLLGMLVRLVYATLMEGVSFSYWRTTLYFLFITSISYETSYGYLITYAIKSGATYIVGILIFILVAKLVGRAMRDGRSAAAAA